jgi:cytochrome c-L
MLGNKTFKSALVASLLTFAGFAISFQAHADCELISNKTGAALPIKADPADSAEAKEFLKTCVNPYTKKYLADAEAAKAGKKVYNYNNCTGCHGGNLEGVMAPGLHKGGGNDIYDTKWTYAKNKTDKGMFETIAGGGSDTTVSNRGVMLTWHKQVPGHTGDGLTTDEILKVIAYIRTKYRGDDEKTWLK